MNPDAQPRYELAVRAAREAGAIALRYYPDTTAAEFVSRIEWKADDSPVSLADREAEVHLRSVLLAAFPDDGFLGEEYGDTVGTSGYRWIVDPIDGTRSFIRGIPLWATLVGLEFRGKMIAGIVVEPCLGNTYRAMLGHGAFKNDKPIRVSTVDRLKDAILCTSDFNYFDKSGTLDTYLTLAKRVQRQRGYGDYFGFTLVAQGSADLMLDFGVHAWDVAALIPLIQEAGGTFTDWHGVTSIDRPDVLASNGMLHEATLAVTRGSVSH